jgi:hypothetical protein
MTLTPEEMFFRAMRHDAFDICELSLHRGSAAVDRRGASVAPDGAAEGVTLSFKI